MTQRPKHPPAWPDFFAAFRNGHWIVFDSNRFSVAETHHTKLEAEQSAQTLLALAEFRKERMAARRGRPH